MKYFFILPCTCNCVSAVSCSYTCNHVILVAHLFQHCHYTSPRENVLLGFVCLEMLDVLLYCLHKEFASQISRYILIALAGNIYKHPRKHSVSLTNLLLTNYKVCSTCESFSCEQISANMY